MLESEKVITEMRHWKIILLTELESVIIQDSIVSECKISLCLNILLSGLNSEWESVRNGKYRKRLSK